MTMEAKSVHLENMVFPMLVTLFGIANDFRMVQGSTHTNLIFDLIIPHGLNMSDDDIVAVIKQKVRELPGDHYALINVEKPYT